MKQSVGGGFGCKIGNRAVQARFQPGCIDTSAENVGIWYGPAYVEVEVVDGCDWGESCT